MDFAPIALFTYNRADHTQRVVESLLQNKEAKDSDLFVFSDGAKNEQTIYSVLENREFIYTIKGFKSVTIIEREKNWGLSKSLIAGITDLVNKFGRVIVVEDDLILSPYFLQFMNEALDKYEIDDRIASIGGFLHPIHGNIPETFFLRNFGCWGWATWKRGWELFNPNAKDLLCQLRWKKRDFNMNDWGPFYGILYCHKVGLVDSWALRFSASCFLKGKLQLIPGRNMAIQNGMDGTGTHSGYNNKFANMKLSMSPIVLHDIPVEENKAMYKAYSVFFADGRKWYYPVVLYDRFKSFVRRLLNIDSK